jgi:hypothetical protein
LDGEEDSADDIDSIVVVVDDDDRPTKYCRSYGTSTTSALSGPLAVVTFRLGHFALIYRSRAAAFVVDKTEIHSLLLLSGHLQG